MDYDKFAIQLCVMSGKDANRPEIDNGGKCLLPQSVFREISFRRIPFPITFELFFPHNGRTTHLGVLEFTASEGTAIVPQWVLDKVSARRLAHIQFATVSLPLGNFLRIRPMQKAFTELSNRVRVLETHLQLNFATLSTGDVFRLNHVGNVFDFTVTEVRCSLLGKCPAVCLVSENLDAYTDLVVEFEPPADMPASPNGSTVPGEEALADFAVATPLPVPFPDGVAPGVSATGLQGTGKQFTAFAGAGSTLSGRKMPTQNGAAKSHSDPATLPTVVDEDEHDAGNQFTPFVGHGHKWDGRKIAGATSTTPGRKLILPLRVAANSTLQTARLPEAAQKQNDQLARELDRVNSQLDQEKQLSRKQKDEFQQQEKAIAELKEKLELAMKELELEKKRPRLDRVKEGILTLDRKNVIDVGATATVYSTKYLDVPVAAKLYHPKIVDDQSIQRELKAAAHLKHPNIVSVNSMIEDDRSDQVHGLLLELMGKDLSRHLKTNPQVSLRQRLQWLLEVSQGIFCSHSLGVIHSDIKPGNILLTTGNPPIAKLADFGCAKILSTAAPSTMGVRGTASFISPEYLNQITGATKQSDIFSFGMTIWTVLHTDVRDNSLGQTAEQMNQSVKGNVRPQIAADVPLEIKTLIEKCWNQDPSQRPTIEEVIQVLTQSVQQLEGQNEITFELSPLWSSEKYLKCKHPSIGTLLNALKWSPGQDAKTLLFSNDIVDPQHPLFQFVASKFRPTAAVQKRSQYAFPGYQFDRKISRIQFVHPKSNIFLQLHDEDNQSRAANSYLNLQPTFFVAQQQKLALEKIKSFFEDPEMSSVNGNSNHSRVLFAWHGTGAENVENVCRDGPRGFRDTDAGFFCAGSYFAAEFDYCTKYSHVSGSNKDGEFSVILYALSVSQAYPVTLEKDYRKIEDAVTPQLHGFSNFYSGDSNRSVALMPRCDSHFIPTKKYYKKHPLGFFQVKERDGSLSNMTSDVAVPLDEQACNEDDDEMTGHEIVLHSHTRALPIAIVYFK